MQRLLPSCDVPVVGGHGVGLLIGDVDPEADDAFGMNADEGVVESALDLLCRGDDLRVAPDLEAAHAPWVDRRDVVNDERCPAVLGDVTKLAAGREPVAVDVEGVELGVVGEPDRVDLKGSVGLDGGKATQGLGGQECELGSENDMVTPP